MATSGEFVTAVVATVTWCPVIRPLTLPKFTYWLAAVRPPRNLPDELEQSRLPNTLKKRVLG